MSRRNFNADFKTKVVLEALKEVNTLAEIAKNYKVYHQQITNWKKEFLSGASSVFHKGKALSAKSEAELEKDRLLRQALHRAQEVLTDEQRFYILHTIKAKKDIQTASIPKLLSHLETFVQRSKAGYFYREFDIDSKNYTWTLPHTEAWCYEMGLWLDKACELAQAENEKAARAIFEACLLLMEQMTAIVFADETGEWMIYTQHDYKAVYEALEQKR